MEQQQEDEEEKHHSPISPLPPPPATTTTKAKKQRLKLLLGDGVHFPYAAMMISPEDPLSSIRDFITANLHALFQETRLMVPPNASADAGGGAHNNNAPLDFDFYYLDDTNTNNNNSRVRILKPFEPEFLAADFIGKQLTPIRCGCDIEGTSMAAAAVSGSPATNTGPANDSGTAVVKTEQDQPQEETAHSAVSTSPPTPTKLRATQAMTRRRPIRRPNPDTTTEEEEDEEEYPTTCPAPLQPPQQPVKEEEEDDDSDEEYEWKDEEAILAEESHPSTCPAQQQPQKQHANEEEEDNVSSSSKEEEEEEEEESPWEGEDGEEEEEEEPTDDKSNRHKDRQPSTMSRKQERRQSQLYASPPDTLEPPPTTTTNSNDKSQPSNVQLQTQQPRPRPALVKKRKLKPDEQHQEQESNNNNDDNNHSHSNSHHNERFPYANRYLLSRGTHGVGRLGGGMKKQPTVGEHDNNHHHNKCQPFRPKPWYHHIWIGPQKLFRDTYPLPRHLWHLKELQDIGALNWRDAVQDMHEFMHEFTYLCCEADDKIWSAEGGPRAAAVMDGPPEYAGKPTATLDGFPQNFATDDKACPVFVLRRNLSTKKPMGWENCGNYKRQSPQPHPQDPSDNETTIPSPQQQHVTTSATNMLCEFVEYDERIYDFCSCLPGGKTSHDKYGTKTTDDPAKAGDWYYQLDMLPNYHSL